MNKKSSYQVLKEKYENLKRYALALERFIMSNGDKELINKFYGNFNFIMVKEGE